MGRKLKLAAYTADEIAAVAAFGEVSHEFDRLEGLMSTWREHSEIQELNAAAGQHPVRVGPWSNWELNNRTCVGGEILIGKRFACWTISTV
jgi:hypothetical protein